jgi:hypothetical protein
MDTLVEYLKKSGVPAWLIVGGLLMAIIVPNVIKIDDRYAKDASTEAQFAVIYHKLDALNDQISTVATNQALILDMLNDEKQEKQEKNSDKAKKIKDATTSLEVTQRNLSALKGSLPRQ